MVTHPGGVAGGVRAARCCQGPASVPARVPSLAVVRAVVGAVARVVAGVVPGVVADVVVLVVPGVACVPRVAGVVGAMPGLGDARDREGGDEAEGEQSLGGAGAHVGGSFRGAVPSGGGAGVRTRCETAGPADNWTFVRP